MGPGERVARIQRVAAGLSLMGGPDLELTLRQFGMPNDDMDAYGSRYAYALPPAEQSDDPALLALDRHLHPDAAASDPVFQPDDDGIWNTGAFRLFISHTSEHRTRAANLATALHSYGIHSFVAHDAVEPTREWQDEIEKALRSCARSAPS